MEVPVSSQADVPLLAQSETPSAGEKSKAPHPPPTHRADPGLQQPFILVPTEKSFYQFSNSSGET